MGWGETSSVLLECWDVEGHTLMLRVWQMNIYTGQPLLKQLLRDAPRKTSKRRHKVTNKMMRNHPVEPKKRWPNIAPRFPRDGSERQ